MPEAPAGMHSPDAPRAKRPRRAYLTECSNCESFAITLPFRDAAGRTYCSEYCLDWATQPTGFCPKCVADTTDYSLDGLFSLYGFGFDFRGSFGKCPVCRSIIRRTWLTLLFIPVIPLRRYRVIHSSPHSFFNRRLREHV